MSTSRDLLANALFPGGAEHPSQQVRGAWYAALAARADLRPQLRVVAAGEHLLRLIPSAGSWDAVAGLPAALQEWWLREAAAWQRRIFELGGEGLPRRLRVWIPDGRAGAATVALFDVLEAAWRAACLAGTPWRLERVDIAVPEAEKNLEAARAVINGFWERDPDLVWEGPQSSERVPFEWTCRLDHADLGADWVLDSPILAATAGPQLPFGKAAIEAPLGPAGEAAGRYFLERFFGDPHFRPGQWEAIRHALAGRPALAALPAGGSGRCYEIPALLLRGVGVVAASPATAARRRADCEQLGPDLVLIVYAAMPETDRQGVLDRLEAGRAKLLFVSPDLLQDQRSVQRLRHAIRKAPGGVSCFAVEDADRSSEWSDAFHPAWANLPAAFAELGDAPVIAVASGAGETLLADVRAQFRIPEEQVVAPAPGGAGPVADPLPAGGRGDYPGYKFEMSDHREQFGLLARHLERGGFASMPGFMPDLPRWDAPPDRAGRIRTWLVRLHGLGHIAAFGESKTVFFVKHEVVPEGDRSAYLGRLRARASELLKGDVPPEFANADAGDLCEALVGQVLGLSWSEARATALFFDRYIAPRLHEARPIEVPKAAPAPGVPGPETERLLYRLKRLGIVREYFAEPRPEGGDEALRWGVAVRRFDRDGFEPGLRAALGALSLDEGTVAALLEEFRAATGPPAPPAEIVLQGLETYLKAFYSVHVRRWRGTGEIARPGAGAVRADLLDLDTAEEWHQAAQRRERDRLAPLFEREVIDLAATPDLAATVAWFAARGRLWSLRDLATERAAQGSARPAAHLIRCCAFQELGGVAAAVEAARQALALPGRPDEAAVRAILAIAFPAVRLALLDGGDVAETLGRRECRRWRHGAFRALRRDAAAAMELLAELRPLSAAWRGADGELAVLAALARRLAAV
ncbi:MAG: hypothetical protein FJZ01_01735 [Candidatus Sericytochromatia bacterium]|nr:hypothetical protein [Candidatus Tanganyikabacteria bacterium]